MPNMRGWGRRGIASWLLAVSFGNLMALGMVGNASACSSAGQISMAQVAEVLRHGDSSAVEDWPFGRPTSIVGVFDRKVMRHWPSDGGVEEASGAVTTEYWGNPPQFELHVFGGATIYSPPTTSSCGPTPPAPPVGAVFYTAGLSTGGSVDIEVDALTADDRALLADLLGGPHAAPVVDVPEDHPFAGTEQSTTTSTTIELSGTDDTEPQALPEPEADDEGSVPIVPVIAAVAAIAVVAGLIAKIRRSTEGS